jgi:hypothetical protein
MPRQRIDRGSTGDRQGIDIGPPTGDHHLVRPVPDPELDSDPAGGTGSVGSISSIGSILSIGSAGSVLSIGSAGSILSIGSAGSVLSIGSAGSVLSIGSLGSILSIGSRGARGQIGAGAPRRQLIPATLRELRRMRARPARNGPTGWRDGLRALQRARTA